MRSAGHGVSRPPREPAHPLASSRQTIPLRLNPRPLIMPLPPLLPEVCALNVQAKDPVTGELVDGEIVDIVEARSRCPISP